jgi:hypothetical protein
VMSRRTSCPSHPLYANSASLSSMHARRPASTAGNLSWLKDGWHSRTLRQFDLSSKLIVRKKEAVPKRSMDARQCPKLVRLAAGE